MAEIEVPFSKALNLWWSFTWRGMVLSLPMFPVSFALMFMLMPFPKKGQPPPHVAPGPLFVKMFAVWIVMVVAMVVLQSLAMRWMLKARWREVAQLLPAPVRDHPDA